MTYQVQRDGQFYGPYTRPDLDQYLASGHILLTDRVKAEDATEWTTVGQMMGSAPPPPPAYGFTVYHDPYASQLPERSGEFTWFPVSPLKFLVMHVCTFGLYTVYWAYKQWDRISTRDTEPMMPWARAIFSGIWNFPLFDQIEDDAAHNEVPVKWNYITLALLVILMTVIGYWVHPPWSGIVFLSFLPWMPVVITIQEINARKAEIVAERPNDRFSGWNIAAIVIGGILKIFALIGTFMAVR